MFLFQQPNSLLCNPPHTKDLALQAECVFCKVHVLGNAMIQATGWASGDYPELIGPATLLLLIVISNMQGLAAAKAGNPTRAVGIRSPRKRREAATVAALPSANWRPEKRRRLAGSVAGSEFEATEGAKSPARRLNRKAGKDLEQKEKAAHRQPQPRYSPFTSFLREGCKVF